MNFTSTSQMLNGLKGDVKFAPLTTRQEQALVEQYKDDRDGLELALVEHNLLLPVKLCNKWVGSVPFDDLYQVAVIGLMEASECFQPSLGYKFSTYATWKIKSQIQTLTRKETRQLSQGMNKSSVVSIDGLDQLDRPILDTLIIETPDKSTEFVEFILTTIKDDDNMTDRQYDIFSCIYRLNLSMVETGGKLGISRQYVSLEHKKVISRLRKYMGHKENYE